MIEAQSLHLEFVRLGGMRYKLKNKMLAILPKIYKSGIYKKYAGSIEEYAGKFGDIGKTTVRKRLSLDKNLEGKPFLNAAIEKVGVHKVAMVAKLATAETDKAFAEKVLNMSKEAVQSLSKELREKAKADYVGGGQMQFCSSDNQTRDYSFDNQPTACHAVARITKIELDEESTFLFMKLKAKLAKHLSDKEFLKIVLKEKVEQEFSAKRENQKEYEFLEKHERKINKAKSQKQQVLKNVTGESFYRIASRYVPAQDRKNSLSQTNNHCSYPNCNLPPKIFHHTDRFANSQSHDSIIPLCKIHHEFAHNNLIKNENMSAEKWQLSVQKPHVSQILQADILYRKYRQKVLL